MIGFPINDIHLVGLPDDVRLVFGLEAEIVLCLRTCAPDMTSHGGFVWPQHGLVEAPDWSPKQVCGYGLHGFAWGVGDGSLASWAEDARWLVFACERREIVDLDGKIKVPRAVVVCCGDRAEAVEYLSARAPAGLAIIGGTSTSGDGGTSTSGDGGTSTSGDGGTSTSGSRGTSTSGDGGTSTSGDGGTSTSGYGGISISGRNGACKASKDGLLVCRWWDWNAGRWQMVVARVGEDGIEADVPYRVVDGRFVRTETEVDL